MIECVVTNVVALVQNHPTIVKTYALTARKSGRCAYVSQQKEWGYLWTEAGQNRLQLWMKGGNLTDQFLRKTLVTQYSPTAMAAADRATFQYGGGYDSQVAYIAKPTSLQFKVW